MTQERLPIGQVGGVVAVVMFAAVAAWVVMPWRGFVEDMEQLNVASALEVRWSGHWGVPELLGEPRVMKPPLAPWVTAAAIDETTIRALQAGDEHTRAEAISRLARRVRIPALISSVALLIGVHALGRALVAPGAGLVAMAVCATTFMFQRYTRWATYDVPLAALVVWANVFLARWLLDGRRWLGAIGAGTCLGLAMLCKGPVALLESVVPVLGFAAWRARATGRSGQSRSMLPALTMIGIIALIALPWFAWVALRTPGVGTLWFNEVTRVKAAAAGESRWFEYLKLFRWYLPWTPWLLAGIYLAGRDLVKSSVQQRSVLALFQLVVPIVVMSFFRDRKGHYLLPMMAPAAVLAGRALWEHIESFPRWKWDERGMLAAHWLMLAAVGVGWPVAIYLGRTADFKGFAGALSRAEVAAVVSVCILSVLGGIAWHQRWRGAAVISGTLIVAMVLGAEEIARRRAGIDRSPLEPVAAAIRKHSASGPILITHPDRHSYMLRQVGAEMEIYLGRPLGVIERRDAAASARSGAVLIAIHPAGTDQELPKGWKALAGLDYRTQAERKQGLTVLVTPGH